jgi:hypothetical protein
MPDPQGLPDRADAETRARFHDTRRACRPDHQIHQSALIRVEGDEAVEGGAAGLGVGGDVGGFGQREGVEFGEEGEGGGRGVGGEGGEGEGNGG